MEAIDYLRQLADDAAGDTSGRLALRAAGVRGIATGLLVAGAITQSQADAALSALNTAAAPSVDTLTKTTTHAGDLHLRMSHEAATATGQEHDQDTTSPASLPHLIAVVPLNRNLRVAIEEIVAVSLEIWTSHLVLHLAYPAIGAGFASQVRAHRPWRGVDGTGTRYKETAAQWSEQAGILAEKRVFEPGGPVTASMLTLITADDQRVDLPLQT